MRFYLLPTFLFSYLLLLPSEAFAGTICPGGQFNTLCDLDIEDGKGSSLVSGIIVVLFIFAVVVSLIFLIWGGIRWTMSEGDKGKVTEARHTVVSAIVGLIISLSAFLIINLVAYFLTGQAFFGGGNAFEIPPLF